MFQVWSKSIEGCWFYSVHKDVTEEPTDGRTDERKDGRTVALLSLRNFVGEGIIKWD